MKSGDVAQKAYSAICGWDPRRDQTVVFADILRKDGLEVVDNIYTGLPRFPDDLP